MQMKFPPSIPQSQSQSQSQSRFRLGLGLDCSLGFISPSLSLLLAEVTIHIELVIPLACFAGSRHLRQEVLRREEAHLLRQILEDRDPLGLRKTNPQEHRLVSLRLEALSSGDSTQGTDNIASPLLRLDGSKCDRMTRTPVTI